MPKTPSVVVLNRAPFRHDHAACTNSGLVCEDMRNGEQTGLAGEPRNWTRRLVPCRLGTVAYWVLERWAECPCPDRSEHYHWVHEGGTGDREQAKRWAENYGIREVSPAGATDEAPSTSEQH